ncbi:hypothetical protein THAOC_06734 [Thalassiosira oceanica]|uniref:UFSP1/2/DUB catalytic domain-containing protein n=1 Tax=Thalassiosira oceanica TaxID=159749 RepID=K0SZL9_THAOC|nr:hypothetical protein THAOC_06734 [Thalassiosira oceanica]|eukprot:EJK71793.1 hypothetical protein THAOC_06734 [Thalassiosira oceanica]
MLLSSLLPRLSAKFPHGVPSILSVQSALEDLWSAGHDPSSARHHGRSIAGTERWIGAVEVWSYLTWLGIDSVLVQFIGDRANRALLGEFCWRYFARTVGDDAGCDSSRHGEDEGGGLEEGSGRIRVCGPTGRVVRVARAATTAADPDLEKHPLARPRVTASDYARRILGQMSCSRRDGRGGPPPRRRGGGTATTAPRGRRPGPVPDRGAVVVSLPPPDILPAEEGGGREAGPRGSSRRRDGGVGAEASPHPVRRAAEQGAGGAGPRGTPRDTLRAPPGEGLPDTPLHGTGAVGGRDREEEEVQPRLGVPRREGRQGDRGRWRRRRGEAGPGGGRRGEAGPRGGSEESAAREVKSRSPRNGGFAPETAPRVAFA